MPAAFTGAIRPESIQQNSGNAKQIGQHRDRSAPRHRHRFHVVRDRRQKEKNGLVAGHDQKQNRTQQQRLLRAKRGEDMHAPRRHLLVFFLLQLSSEPALLIVRKPARLMHAISQVEQREHTQQHRRHTFEEEHPPPSMHAAPMHVLQNPTRERRTDHHRQRLRHHEPRLRARAVFVPKPMRQIHNHAREETGFRRAQQKTRRVELRCCRNKAGQSRDQRPT